MWLTFQAFSDYRFTYNATVIIHQEELTNYKIKLENLFSRTDEKEMSNE